MMEGLKEALQYIAKLKEESMEPKVLEINGDTYCNKDLMRYHRFPMADRLGVNTLTALVEYQRQAGGTPGEHDPACGESGVCPDVFRSD